VQVSQPNHLIIWINGFTTFQQLYIWVHAASSFIRQLGTTEFDHHRDDGAASAGCYSLWRLYTHSRVASSLDLPVDEPYVQWEASSWLHGLTYCWRDTPTLEVKLFIGHSRLLQAEAEKV